MIFEIIYDDNDELIPIKMILLKYWVVFPEDFFFRLWNVLITLSNLSICIIKISQFPMKYFYA